MGTRSLTHFHQRGLDSPVLCTMYAQYDGYPSGIGDDIKKIIGNKKLVNGYSNAAAEVNGMGDAAAQVIAYCKTDGARKPIGAGGVYMQIAGEGKEEFNYHLFTVGGTGDWNGEQGVIHISVTAYGKQWWSGPLSEFDAEMIEAKERDK